MEGISIDIGTIMDGDFSFELKEDGTCVATIGTEQESGKWEESDTGFVVEGEFEAVVDGDTAVIDYDGLKMNMEKA